LATLAPSAFAIRADLAAQAMPTPTAQQSIAEKDKSCYKIPAGRMDRRWRRITSFDVFLSKSRSGKKFFI
jgi:hypothetical protein